MNKKTILFALFFITLFSCAKDDKITLVDSSGRINNILIVIKNADWDNEIGDALRDIISQPLEGLPQDEAQFSITHVPPITFNSLFKRSRNILFVGFAKKNMFYSNINIYASPQITISVLSDTKENLIKNINNHKKEIISIFKKNDLKLFQKKITKDSYDPKTIKTFKQLNFSLKIPTSYAQVEDTGNFLWFRNTFTKGLLNIIAYQIPLSSKLNLDSIIKYRDSIGKKYIPGQFDNTYLKTEPQFKPITHKVKISGFDAIELRGLWIVKGDYMGGPFITYAIKDTKNNRILIIEGFSYSPASKKRDFVFELEAILKTLVIN